MIWNTHIYIYIHIEYIEIYVRTCKCNQVCARTFFIYYALTGLVHVVCNPVLPMFEGRNGVINLGTRHPDPYWTKNSTGNLYAIAMDWTIPSLCGKKHIGSLSIKYDGQQIFG